MCYYSIHIALYCFQAPWSGDTATTQFPSLSVRSPCRRAAVTRSPVFNADTPSGVPVNIQSPGCTGKYAFK